MNDYLVTSESVTEGHPDKLCDQIADGLLDKYLEGDNQSRVALEVMASRGALMIAGEVTSNTKVDIVKTAREIIKDVGYVDEKMGFDYKSCLIFTNIHTQSIDIAQGVNRFSTLDNDKKLLGAGDQGIMYGYACDETKNFMPITVDLANKLSLKLAELRKNNSIPWIYPDGKTQVTMNYNDRDEPINITSIVVSTQHDENISNEYIYSTILNEVIYPTIDSKYINFNTRIHINPTGRFVIGGPGADTGVTGRKLMVDTYGGIGKHGGGAFSGKDPTKVDRSAAYMARYVAKNIVAAGLANKCEVSIAFAIGLTQPEAITINTFGTEQIKLEYINAIVKEIFSFSVADILEQLYLRKPQFLKTASYGHFGRENQGFQWEKTDKVELLQKKAIKYVMGMFNKN